MKKLINFTIVVFVLAGMAGCSGTEGKVNTQGTPATPDTANWIKEHSRIPEVDTVMVKIEISNRIRDVMAYELMANDSLLDAVNKPRAKRVQDWYNYTTMPHARRMVDTINEVRGGRCVRGAPSNTKVSPEYFELLTGLKTLKGESHKRDCGVLVFGL